MPTQEAIEKARKIISFHTVQGGIDQLYDLLRNNTLLRHKHSKGG
jgi:hypothetical protein